MDHAHDALMLALLAITQNYGDLMKSNYTTKTNYLLRVKPNGYIQWEYNGYTDTDSVPLQLNTWHHIVVTNDYNVTAKLYIDGKLIGTANPLDATTTFGSNSLTKYIAETIK